jgi:soluble lytic murein transglycosylase-like protein
MAKFSSPRGMFGAPMDTPPWSTPPIAPAPGADAVNIDAHIPTYKKPGTGQMIAGLVGDALLNWSGGRPMFMPSIQAQQQQAAEAQAAQVQRAQEFADWERRKQWERDNPAPINNDTVADYNFRVQTLGKEAADAWLRSAGDPDIAITLPGNRFYSGPRSGLGAALSAGGAAPVQRPAIGAELPDPRKTGGASPTGSRTFQPAAVMDALISVESGGRAGVLGPETRYGRAQGLTQMLPATAQQMAQKLGVPWRPDLMTGTGEAAAAYQRALGQAYLDEGYQSTGSIRDALHYYHGGPNRKMWGPKTRQYAQNVISRIGDR